MKKAVLIILLSIIIMEVLLRIMSYKPFQVDPPNSKATTMFQLDSLLGYTLLPGNYIVPFGKGELLNNTILPNQTRATSSNASFIKNDIDTFSKIHIYGCSITYGYFLDDSSTMAWKIQEKANMNFINFGVPGYGPLHFYLQIKNNLANNISPKVLCINYGSFQDSRNLLTRNIQKNFYHNNNILLPKVEIIDDSLSIKYISPSYKPFPLSKYSSLINLIQISYDKHEGILKNDVKSSKIIFQKIINLVNEKKIKLVVFGIANDLKTKKMLEWLSNKGVYTFDISIDMGDNKYNLMPYDPHPNNLANTLFADKIYKILNDSKILH